MPPTKEVSSPAKTGDTAARAHAVALEVPVTVHGARAVEGSDKREPFSETTTTVLVMGKGAVIRLSAPVTPGQLIFLTNAKTKKEVVCQVVKSKNYRNVSGYVELEFTEPVVGFWGLRFPADHVSGQSITSAPVATAEATALAVRTEEKSGFVGANNAPVLPSPRAAEPSAPAPVAAGFASTESLKSQAARLQSQLSSMTFGPAATTPVTPVTPERKSPAPEAEAPRIIKSEPARAKETPAVKIPEIKSTLEVEEVKIPSWLEPLARNAPAPAPAEEEEVAPAKAAPPKAIQPERVREEVAALATDVDRAAAPAAKTAAASFGSRVLTDNLAVPAAKAPRGGHRGTLVGAFAAVLVLVAGAYWYLQPKSRAAVSSPTATGSSSELARSVPASAPQTVSANSKFSAAKDTSNAAMSGNVVPPAALGATSREQQANLSTPAYAADVSKAAARTNVTEASLQAAQPAEPLKPAVKKPNLGRVRLATPRLNGRRVAQSATEAPNLDVGGQGSPRGDALGNALVSGGGTPAAPPSLPLGGDVKPARLSVSVAPVYPAIARSQRISGDVRIDALIDVNGRVSEMKVISGPAVLHQAAMDALRRWKYAPATLDGNPVPMHLAVTIQFRLQ
jgi:TonB family protein